MSGLCSRSEETEEISNLKQNRKNLSTVNSFLTKTYIILAYTQTLYFLFGDRRVCACENIKSGNLEPASAKRGG